MAVRKLVFLSDIHVGTNQPVNWYQKELHEPYLQAALGHIHKTAAEIDELIVLGDMVDLWTYLPDRPPASFKDVLSANPNLLGYGGPPGRGLLAQVLTALDGRMSFMNGNHDMTVTQADLDLIRGLQNQTMRRIESMTYSPKGGLGKVVCTHGHIFSVFCAPDPQGLFGALPIGYFVTRLAAQWDHKQLTEHYPAGATVADMPNTGTPTGWGFKKKNVERILDGVLNGDDGLAEVLFDVILGSDGKQQAQSFVLPDGTVSANAYKLARTTYSNAYEGWVKRASQYPDIFGDPTIDDPGPVALAEVDFEDSLLHFAKILGEQYKVVVMGHTHAPKDRIDYPWFIKKLGESLYVNCGFNCPSRPDMTGKNPKHPTFVELAVDEARKRCTAQVRFVEKQGASYRVAEKPLEQVEIAL